MNRENRTSVGQLIQNSSDLEQQKPESSINSSNFTQTANELNPMQQILKQYIRESSLGTKKNTTLQQFSEKENLKPRRERGCSLFKCLQEKENQELQISQIQAVSISRMGIRNYDNMENQDVILDDQICHKCKVYGIFDGHGRYGRDIALTAKNIFYNYLQKYTEDMKGQCSMFPVQTIVKKVLEKTNAYLLHVKAEEAQFSGTTALITVITPTTIYVFNIGNSRVVLGKYYESTKKIEPYQITHDHSLFRFDERSRIIKSGGVIAPYKNERGEQIGPERIWAPGQKYPGIMVTRTLGLSCSYKLGVISEPEVSIIKYKTCFKFLLIASDGLWRVESNDEAINMFYKMPVTNSVGYANSLMFQAIKRWRGREQLMDDVSLIMIPLQRQ